MPLDDPYCDATFYGQVVPRKDTGQNDAITDDLKAVSRSLIDLHLGQFFNKAETVQERFMFAPSESGPGVLGNSWTTGQRGITELEMPAPLADKTDFVLKTDDDGDGICETVWTIDTDFLLTGFGGEDDLNPELDPEPRPWTHILIPRKTTTAASKYWFYPGQKMSMEGYWGWPAVPVAIKVATAQLTAILRLDSPRATARVPEAINAVIQTSMAGQRIISDLQQHYRRRWHF